MIIKRLKEENKGSILILTMLALVGAISIAVAMSSVSIVERKMTTKTRKSTTAFQSANSGVEWAMKMINDSEGISTGVDKDITIKDVFGASKLDSSNGKISCPAVLFSNNSGLDCTITLLKRAADGTRVFIDDEDAGMESIVAIRSAGTFGKDMEKVGRALEAYAMPNCGADSERVADFCIDKTDSNGVEKWGEAVTTCEGGGKRLCTAAELVAANADFGPLPAELFSADVVSATEYAVVDGSNISSVIDDANIKSDNKNFRCCRNR